MDLSPEILSKDWLLRFRDIDIQIKCQSYTNNINQFLEIRFTKNYFSNIFFPKIKIKKSIFHKKNPKNFNFLKTL